MHHNSSEPPSQTSEVTAMSRTPAPPQTGPELRGPDQSDAPPRPGPLGRLAGLTFRHRGRTVLAWVLVLVLAGVLSTAFGGEFKADYSAPGSDSKAAQNLLEQRFPAQSGATVDVVVHADGSVTTPAVRSDVRALLARLGTLPHVASVDDPYRTPGGISPDGRTLLATARLDVANPVDMPVADSQQLLDLAASSSVAGRDGVTVALGGQSIQQAEQGSIGSEGIGLAAAAVILLLTFGSVVAAGLPILVAVAGLAVSSLLTGLVISVVDAPDWSTSLATMMGIGIGIDYALLMVTRFREWRAGGPGPHPAPRAPPGTPRRPVLGAGATPPVR